MGKRFNETEFEDGKKIVVFAGDFDMARQINEAGRDVQLIFVDLSNGLMPAEDIKNVMVAGLVSIDGEKFKDSKIEPYIEYLISEYGLEECSVVARLLLSHALLGDKKKLRTVKAEEIRTIMTDLLPSPSKNLLHLGLFLVATSLTSAGLVCGIIKLFGKHILQ